MQIEIFDRTEFREWLRLNFDKEKRVEVIIHKKHTKKPSPSHRELLEEALCFGWIDTTINRLDENRFIRTFVKRKKSARWSENTLSYAKRLIKEKKMMPSGLICYKEGLRKFNIQKNKI